MEKFIEAEKLLQKSYSEIKKYHNERGRQYIKLHWNRYVNLLSFMPPVDKTMRVLEIGASILSSHLHHTYGCPTTVIYHPLEPEWKDRFDNTGIDSFAVELMKEPLPVDNNSFELILFNEVMEHFPLHPAFFFYQLFQKLSEKGSLVFSVPNFATSEKRLQMLSGRNPQDMMDQNYIYYAHHREPVMEECCSIIKQCGGVIKLRKWLDMDENPGFLHTLKLMFFHLYRRRVHPFFHLLFPSMRKYILIIAGKDPGIKPDDSLCVPPLLRSREYE
jgi:SAM-dependent methyltransferase